MSRLGINRRVELGSGDSMGVCLSCFVGKMVFSAVNWSLGVLLVLQNEFIVGFAVHISARVRITIARKYRPLRFYC